LIGRSDIKTAEDLKGKKVAISRFGSASDFAAREALKKLRLDPTKDTGDHPGRRAERPVRCPDAKRGASERFLTSRFPPSRSPSTR
jgi:ABC-type nitrate/sulfonate/bicarbonate transport system substrate-binding protein